MTSEDSLKKKTNPPTPKTTGIPENTTVKVENLEVDGANYINLDQYAPESQNIDRANENPHLIEEGKNYQRNGAQQLYEDIIRQQKMITELTQNRPQLSSHGSSILPSARSNNEEQTPHTQRATAFMASNVSTFTFTNPVTAQENSPIADKVKEGREDESPMNNLMMMNTGAMTTMSSHPAQSSAQRFRRTSYLRISAAGIETKFSSIEFNQTTQNQFETWKKNRISRRTI